MQYRKSGHGLSLALFGFAFCLLFLSPFQLSGQSSGVSPSQDSEEWQLPEWLKPPMHQAPPNDPTKSLLLSMAESLESWGEWSIKVETWYLELADTVKKIMISSDEREKSHQAAIDAKNLVISALIAENELLKSQNKNQLEIGLISGGGGFLGGFALGVLAGSSIKK